MKKVFGFIALLIFAGSANAGAIYSAVSANINSGGPGFGSINDTFNQNGLSTGYTSGVDDFDTYIGAGPTHTTDFLGFEWFSNQGSNSASVTYDLGSSLSMDSMALWNEEGSGIGVLDLLISNDGVAFSSLLSGLSPTDNLTGDYGAEVFSFGAVSAQYVRLDMAQCPQAPAYFTSCAIGEVAFRGATVPEPATIALFATGLFGLGFARRRIRK